jgi:hypothetical protein
MRSSTVLQAGLLTYIWNAIAGNVSWGKDVNSEDLEL